jgi:hypothetical protein
MCYDEKLFRPWAANRAPKRQKIQPLTERDRQREVPVPQTSSAETERRQEIKRELEEVV